MFEFSEKCRKINNNGSLDNLKKEIEDLGLAKKTLIIFCSDNGGIGRLGSSNGIYRGTKGTFFEGGQGTSYGWRQFEHEMGLAKLAQTYGIGVGIGGEYRAGSLVAYLDGPV